MTYTDKNSKIEYGKVEFEPEEFDPKNVKFRMNMWIDLDLLNVIKKQAKHEGQKYQTWLNKFLRDKLMSDGQTVESRLAKLENEVVKLKDALKKAS